MECIYTKGASMWSLYRQVKYFNPTVLGGIISRSSSNFVRSPAGDGSRFLQSDQLDLVIFDKDGTLICIDSMWIPWMENQVQKLENAAGIPLEQKLYKWWGYDKESAKFTDQSILAHHTSEFIKNQMVAHLSAEGFPKSFAEKLLCDCWEDCDSNNPSHLKPLSNVASIFSTLKQKGIKTAVCTSDSRQGTIPTLQELGVLDMVDKIICSDDSGARPKPHPHNIWHICEELNICPSKTLMIGDTTTDTQMGHSAGVGLVVGVLSGAGEKSSLEKQADIVLNHVGELLPLICDKSEKHSS